jgi:hypothetical protein
VTSFDVPSHNKRTYSRLRLPGVELEVKDAKLADATVRVAQGAAGSQTLLHQIRNENRSLAELWPLLLETTPDSELGRTVTAKTATGAVNPSHRFALLAVARNLLEAPGIFISSAVTLYIDARRQFLFNLQRSSEAWEAWDVEPVLPALYEDRCRDNQKRFRKGLADDLLSSYNLLWFLAQKTNVQWTALEGLLCPNVPGMPKFIQETIARIRGVTRNTLSPADYGLIREQFPPELRAAADWLVVKTGRNAIAQDLGIKGSLLDLDRRFTVLLPRLQSQKQTVRLVVESGVAKDKDKATREMTRRHATAVGFFSNVHRIAAAIQHRKESSVPGMIDAIQQAAAIAGGQYKDEKVPTLDMLLYGAFGRKGGFAAIYSVAEALAAEYGQSITPRTVRSYLPQAHVKLMKVLNDNPSSTWLHITVRGPTS